MSNVETSPVETTCGEQHTPGAALEVITPREVPLGGPRAMTVRRTLPSRHRTMVGAWCFADHYGPDQVAETGGMVVPPHPHTGLQTVSWLFTGEVEHRDSLGTHAVVRPGELNLMTAGHGISHSEVSTPGTTTLHGVQLWVALPAAFADTAPQFERYAAEPVEVDGATVSVFIGSLSVPGRDEVMASPVTTWSPLLGAEVTLPPGGRLTLAVDPAYEHGVLVDGGPVHVEGRQTDRAELAFVAAGRDRLEIVAGDDGGRVVLLGGEPFAEQIVMWWNFIGRSHDDVAAARAQWQAELGGADAVRFGLFDYPGDRLPAPELPGVRLRPRG